ncbi:hypothetical protein ACFWIW_11255 [Amycolatopsis sp. NPDC058340]|uniref:hypothetical protein n=1 Tax=Amycolatopsis sp. NPDC058340 TaxID=3346453 RepID=UPI0036563C2D
MINVAVSCDDVAASSVLKLRAIDYSLSGQKKVKLLPRVVFIPGRLRSIPVNRSGERVNSLLFEGGDGLFGGTGAALDRTSIAAWSPRHEPVRAKPPLSTKDV